MDRIKKLKIKKQDGTFSDYIPIGADAENIDTTDGESVQLKLNKKPYYYDNVAAMKADTKLKVGDMAITLGYYEANDGGGAEYNIIDGDYTDDGGSYHELENNLFAELITKDRVSIKQFGAYGDNIHDDTTVFQSVIEKYQNVFINQGLYKITQTLTINTKLVLQGENLYNTGIFYEGINYLFSAGTAWNYDFVVDNISFTGKVDNNFLYLKVPNKNWGASCTFTNFAVWKFNQILNTYGAFNMSFEHGSFNSNGTFLIDSAGASTAMTNANKFRDVYFKTYSASEDAQNYPNYRMTINGARNLLFEGCSFEQCKTFFNISADSQHIVCNNCGFEQMDYVFAGTGIIIDETNYMYQILAPKEDGIYYSNRDKFINRAYDLQENESRFSYIRKAARNQALNTQMSYIYNDYNDSAQLYNLSSKEWNIYVPINSFVKKEENTNSISINFNSQQIMKYQDGDSFYFKIIIWTSGNGGDLLIRQKEYLLKDRYGSPYLIEDKELIKQTWSGSDMETTTFTETFSNGIFKTEASKNVLRYNLIVKWEILGDFISH